MPAAVTQAEKQRYLILRREGFTIKEASQQLKRSYAWAKAFEQGLKDSSGQTFREIRQAADMPMGPIPFDQLSGVARDCLDDFGRFRARYLGRVSSPWQVDAGQRVAEKLESQQKEYVVINVSPGTGKTTTFTHDLPAWLTCRNRALRGCLGHRVQARADDYLRRLKATFERRVAPQASDDDIKRGLSLDAEASLIQDYGPFKPEVNDIWTRGQFTVWQHGEAGADQKESTWVSFGQDTGFLGYRVNFINWDDLIDTRKLRNLEWIENQRIWWDTEAETRLEPHGLLLLVGQRLGAHDLYRYCLDKRTGLEELEVDEDFDSTRLGRKYHHIIYRAHYESQCRADEDAAVHSRNAQPYVPGDPDSGCLLDPLRLPWRELKAAQAVGNYQTVYQQEDVDPSDVLVQQIWVDGGRGLDGVDFPGCWDEDRDLGELPRGLDGRKLSIVTCDPSPTQFWSIQNWLYLESMNVEPGAGLRYLIDHERRKMSAPDFLDWSPSFNMFTGLLEDWWQRSKDIGCPITHLIVEANAAQRFMLQYEFFRRWAQTRGVHLIPHQTQRNKLDPNFGVQTIAQQWRLGRVRLPGARANRGRFASLYLVNEVTRYPDTPTDDCVMAQWFLEYHLNRLRNAGAKIGSIYGDMPSWVKRRTDAA
jgi:hypothetical protein